MQYVDGVGLSDFSCIRFGAGVQLFHDGDHASVDTMLFSPITD
jgi:hypothetical protein